MTIMTHLTSRFYLALEVLNCVLSNTSRILVTTGLSPSYTIDSGGPR
jgi:hypothetical protein